MSVRVKRISTNKLDDLFAEAVPSSSSSSAIPIRFPSLRDLPVAAIPSPFKPPALLHPDALMKSATPSTTSTSSLRSNSEEEEEEYGHYHFMAADEPGSCREGGSGAPGDDSLLMRSSSRSLAFSSSFRSLPTTPLGISRSLSRTASSSAMSVSVICQYEDDKPTLTCRSFETIELNTKLTVFIALSGIRILHEGDWNLTEIPEYKLRVTIDGQEFLSWKRFEDFQALGEACSQYMKDKRGGGGSGGGLGGWMGGVGGAGRERRGGRGKDKKYSLTNTVSAWKDVLRHRPFWAKTSSLKFLTEEQQLLENFMKNLLFEIPSIELLVEFLT